MQLHPWSTGAAPPRRSEPPRRLSPEQVAAFDRDGFVVVQGAIDAATIARLVSALDPLERAVRESLAARPGGRFLLSRTGTISFVYNPAARDPMLRAFVSGEPFASLAHDLVGPDVRVFWDQAVYKHGADPRPFPWHQDNGYGFVAPESYLTCWVALVDTTEGNGCPRVLPGRHREGTFVHEPCDDGFALPIGDHAGVPVPLCAGDVLCFSSLLPHATGPNRTGAPRRAYLAQYTTEDAVYLRGDPAAGPPAAREAVRDLPAARQWVVVRDGEPVAD